MVGFVVTYELVDDESAEDRDAFERGFVTEEPVNLRYAVELLYDINSFNGLECIEPNCSDDEYVDWVSLYGGLVYGYERNVWETRSIHFPDNITQSSRKRLVRLLTQ